ncbi:DNA repair and recombination protein RadB [Candidatus Pacearchaeota archaeon]|nr:MAG: DNA repair and recombination protein RadB [Candidatus Pacearchaeota archaeon]
MKTTKVSAGSYDLNRFLHGGYETDIITTIYGPGGSGKSNLCMVLAVSQAKKDNKVLIIDTEGGFSVDRFKQIHGGRKEEIEQALQNILILKPTSFREQEKIFDNLATHIKKGPVSTLIVDSIAMLYRLELGTAINSGHEEKIALVNRKLALQLRALNEIARKKNIPVIVTNQVYSQFSSEEAEKKIFMVGGDLLKYWSKCLLELQVRGGRRKIIIRKHRSLPQKEMSFEIVNSGIRKKGIF